jgi:sugar lactone lactonase YvrE
MDRRDALRTAVALWGLRRLLPLPLPLQSTVSTLIGTGSAGYSERQVSNPYGLAIGPDGALYFCDLDNQRIRRLDLHTRETRTVAGNGRQGYDGDGGPATSASLNMPHEIQFDADGHLYIVERDNHVVRMVHATTGVISTVAGTGSRGFSGDGGPARAAQLGAPHSIAVDPTGRFLFIGDTGNHRIRRVALATGLIETFAGTGGTGSTPEAAPRSGTPLHGPRAMAFDAAGALYLALREGNAVFRIDMTTERWHRVAGTGEAGASGDGGPAVRATLGGPKGLACSGGLLYIADTENHVIRAVDLTTGVIRTVLGSGQPGDGPEPDPMQCALDRPHGVLVDARGALYVGDSENHRIRVLSPVAGANRTPSPG